MVELYEGITKARIDLQGAWLTTLEDSEGDILFPKRLLTLPDGSTKQRGGCHVCLPNFGPGGVSTQPQHGFGRTSLWQLRSHSSNTATLVLKNGPGDYAGLESALSYTLHSRSLAIILHATNHNTSDMRLAPGFHPYIALGTDEQTVDINHTTLRTKLLEETRFVSGDNMIVTTTRRRLTLASRELPVWAEWTDSLGSYVCVEPTRGGYMFLKQTPDKKEIIAPGETKAYDFSLSWS